MSAVLRLKKRADFLSVAQKGGKFKTPSFCFSYLFSDENACRVGFTASRKVGNAVVRNRCKRRLKALVHTHLKKECLKHNALSLDIVIIAYKGLDQKLFNDLETDFLVSLHHLSKKIKKHEKNTDFSCKNI
jgi:ribonuclease P protein component